jgi:hypothetical protein
MKNLKKPRSYSDFTLSHLREMFGIENASFPLNLAQKLAMPSELLVSTLHRNQVISLNSEKAKSEFLIAPILAELANRKPLLFSCFSGNMLDVDVTRSLRGRCDFLLTRQMSLDITAPIIAIFEAKDDSLDHWYGQCGSEMLASRIFNEERGEPISIIHGAVTNGFTWQFLRLEGTALLVDTEIFTLKELPRLLGALEFLIDFYHT